MVTLGHERSSSSSSAGRRNGLRCDGWRREPPTWKNNILGSPASVTQSLRLRCPTTKGAGGPSFSIDNHSIIVSRARKGKPFRDAVTKGAAKLSASQIGLWEPANFVDGAARFVRAA